MHTPEYAFEHVPSNVAAGAQRLGITFPVALDNSFDTWNAYDNQSWPAAYLIDATGQIRHISIGEGDYAGEEQLIRQLLTSRAPRSRPAQADRRARHHAYRRRADAGDLPRRRARTGLRRQRRLRERPVHPARRPPRERLRPVRHLDHRPAVDHRGQGRRDQARLPRLDVYLDVGGTGTLTVSSGGKSKVIRVSGAPDIYTVATEQPAADGIVTIGLSPGLQAYSFTFG